MPTVILKTEYLHCDLRDDDLYGNTGAYWSLEATVNDTTLTENLYVHVVKDEKLTINAFGDMVSFTAQVHSNKYGIMEYPGGNVGTLEVKDAEDADADRSYPHWGIAVDMPAARLIQHENGCDHLVLTLLFEVEEAKLDAFLAASRNFLETAQDSDPEDFFCCPTLTSQLRTLEYAHKTLSYEELYLGQPLHDDGIAKFKINVGNTTFYVHRSVMCTRSGYFKGMITGDTPEAAEGRAVINDVEPDRMRGFLRVVYNYWKILDVADDCRTLASLYRLADRFLVPDVADLARLGLRSATIPEEHLVEMLHFAKTYDLTTGLMKRCASYISKSLVSCEVLIAVYTLAVEQNMDHIRALTLKALKATSVTPGNVSALLTFAHENDLGNLLIHYFEATSKFPVQMDGSVDQFFKSHPQIMMHLQREQRRACRKRAAEVEPADMDD